MVFLTIPENALEPTGRKNPTRMRAVREEDTLAWVEVAS